MLARSLNREHRFLFFCFLFFVGRSSYRARLLDILSLLDLLLGLLKMQMIDQKQHSPRRKESSLKVFIMTHPP